jgi:hypothetical protein
MYMGMSYPCRGVGSRTGAGRAAAPLDRKTEACDNPADPASWLIG